MRSKVLLMAALLVVTTPRRAVAVPYDFSAGSWIIPMDVCSQPSKSFNGSTYASSAYSSTVYGATCPDSSGTARDGILKAYGLVYRLLQNNVPVYYILDTTKTTVDGPDLTVTNASTTPVALLNHATGASSEFMAAAHRSIAYRGAPFIISAADVPRALNLLNNNSSFNATDSRTGRGMFADVYIHVAKSNILQAPVRALLMQTPPKIALLDIGGAAIGVLEGYLKDAGLYTTTATANYPTLGDVFTRFDSVTDFTTSDGLNAGGFQILWAPHWEGNYTITTTQRDQVMQKINAFIDAGHPFVAQCAAISTYEGANSPLSYGDEPATSYGHLMVNTSGTTVGLATNALSQPSFPGSGQAIVVNPDPVVKAWIDPLTQTGDWPLNINVQSWTFDFKPSAGLGYKTFVRSMVQSSTGSSATNNLQIEAVANKDGDPTKGLVIYLGGHSYGSQGSTCSGSCSTFSQYNTIGLERLVLNSLIFLGQQPQSQELTRSAPIVWSDGSTFVGSYLQQSLPSTAFPPWQGHFRHFPAGRLAGTNVTAFNDSTLNISGGGYWDAAANIAAQAGADSRTLFTGSTAFTTANAAALGIPAATITAIRKGGLGGIDHSIPAIIGPSPLAGSASRPTVAYVGALDGMLHAILVSPATLSIGAQSYAAGDELWAFIPPSQKAKVVAQTGGVDGSPVVGDAFIDTGGGVRAWRTILAVSDGQYAGGTVDALDVTDPAHPVFLWEGADTFTVASKTYVMGRSQGGALGSIKTSSGVKYAVFLLTDNTNGSAGNGFNLYALDAGTGAVIWRYNYAYTHDTTHNDVPGMPAIIDAAGDGGANDTVFFADLEGKVWSVPAASGVGGTVLWDAAVAYGQPSSVNYPVESGVALYRDPTTSKLTIAGATGGADWVPAATLSTVFKVDVQSHTGTTLYTLAAGERIYASPTIYGNQLYFISSFGNIQLGIGNDFQASGNLYRIDLGTSVVTALATVKQGASEVAIDTSTVSSGGNASVIAMSAAGITQNANSGRNTSQMVIQLQNAPPKPGAARAWLDLH